MPARNVGLLAPRPGAADAAATRRSDSHDCRRLALRIIRACAMAGTGVRHRVGPLRSRAYNGLVAYA